jgi:hypothetical protein
MSQNPPQAPHTDAILFGAEEQLRDVQVFDTMTEATRIQRSRPRVDPIPATRSADDKNLKIKVAKRRKGATRQQDVSGFRLEIPDHQTFYPLRIILHDKQTAAGLLTVSICRYILHIAPRTKWFVDFQNLTFNQPSNVSR